MSPRCKLASERRCVCARLEGFPAEIEQAALHTYTYTRANTPHKNTSVTHLSESVRELRQGQRSRRPITTARGRKTPCDTCWRANRHKPDTDTQTTQRPRMKNKLQNPHSFLLSFICMDLVLSFFFLCLCPPPPLPASFTSAEPEVRSHQR